MTTQHKIDIGIGIALLIAVIVIGRSWLDEHDNRLKAEASIAAAQKSFDQASAQLKQLQEADKQRDAQTAAAIAQISSAAAAQKTPQQITNWIPAQFSGAPQPIQASIAPASAQNPTPPAIFTVPQADLSFLRDQVATCQKNAVALSGAQQDLSSCQAQQKYLQEQVKDRDDQIAALNQELKGGTFWHRFKAGAEKLGIGAAIAAAGICASGHCK